MKSNRPSVAHCAVTLAPICSSSRLTSLMRFGLFFTVWTPSAVRVVSMMNVGIGLLSDGYVRRYRRNRPASESLLNRKASSTSPHGPWARLRGETTCCWDPGNGPCRGPGHRREGEPAGGQPAGSPAFGDRFGRPFRGAFGLLFGDASACFGSFSGGFLNGDDRELSDLAALADGSLPPERRAEVESRVASSPRLQALLREQRQALEAVRSRDDRAPRRLHVAVARLPRRRKRPVAVAAGLAAAAAGVLVLLVLPGSEQADPTLLQAAALAARAPVSAKPSGGGSGPVLTGLNAWGIQYPNLSRKGGWRASGSRTDSVSGRSAR